MPEAWVRVCTIDEIEEKMFRRFDHDGRTFAVYHLAGGRFYATEGLCTHAKVHLSGGLVMGKIIECPKHNGRFDVTTGKAQGAPACIDLQTFPVKVEAGEVLIQVA